MGGWAAELLSGEANDGVPCDSGDMSCVLSRIDQFAPSRVKIELGWAEDEAHRIVCANLDRVQRLADVLLDRLELTDANEIRDIIEGR
jgi:hypothetical protein